MQALKPYLLQLKQNIKQKQDQQQLVGDLLKNFIRQEFKNEQTVLYLKSFHFQKQTLFIETTLSVFKQELYWRREYLKRYLNERDKNLLIKKIVIKSNN